ncbi:MAG: site-specific DNA-methyltransferase [Sphingomonadales bacterium]|nr:site-specific DNA-methyltransferase [Sphingomonadaceae bacterium]MBS3930336.1 site-specific DNA-methyltransferase [Sphingomonadales bacterium]
MMAVEIIVGDCRDVLAQMPDRSVQCCVTSPPYFGLRDYGVDGQIGLEASPEEFVGELVAVFHEVRRVLADDGTLWLNLGDSYAASGMGGNPAESSHRKQATNVGSLVAGRKAPDGFKPKDLLGIPWRVAFALQSDGWYLRQDIIWAKPNPMPESVTDRCTKAHEYIFMLSKSAQYFYDAASVAEPAVSTDVKKFTDGGRDKQRGHGRRHEGFNGRYAAKLAADGVPATRNRRSVWAVATAPFKEAHFATFPPEIPKLCIRAGSRVGDTILDPFGGAGTTGLVADGLGRNATLIELNSSYAAMAHNRILAAAPLLVNVSGG